MTESLSFSFGIKAPYLSPAAAIPAAGGSQAGPGGSRACPALGPQQAVVGEIAPRDMGHLAALGADDGRHVAVAGVAMPFQPGRAEQVVGVGRERHARADPSLRPLARRLFQQIEAFLDGVGLLLRG